MDRDPDSLGTEDEAYYPGGFGQYEKHFDIDFSAKDCRVFLAFDGVYRFAEIRVNLQLVCLHKGGYSPFTVDITRAVHAGRNTLHVITSCALLPASRWYTGAGLYRSVNLLTGTIPCIAPQGVRLTTRVADEKQSIVQVQTSVLSPGNIPYSVRQTVTDPDGQIVATGGDGEITLAHAKLWSADTPHLYTLTTDVLVDGTVNDTTTTVFGLRTVSVDRVKGFQVNGQSVLLKGGCLHHDNGIVGSVSTRGIELRKVRILKQAGYNAIRCAHNPPSTALLEACDKLGLYVIDEAFDAWREGKRAYDEHLFFEDEWENEITAMISRDYNHPCVVMWSTGNEIYERCGASEGASWSHRLAGKVRELDRSRPIINALCGFFEEGILADTEANLKSTTGEGKDYWARKSEDFASALDIVGYNYLLDRYEKDALLFPNRIFCGTESFPRQARENWLAVQNIPNVIGDFVWTAWEYLGESGLGHSDFNTDSGFQHRFFPWHVANCGDLDICGHKRPQSHYRDFVWSDRTAPYIGVQHPSHFGQQEIVSAWGWPDLNDQWTVPGYEDHKIQVVVYSAGDSVVLKLNGQIIGETRTDKYIAVFEVSFRPGKLEAESYKGGQLIGTAQLNTSGTPASLHATLEGHDDDNIRFMTIEIHDAAGIRVANAADEVTLEVDGAELLGFGSGDPASTHNYSTPVAVPFNGRLLAVLRLTSSNATIRCRYPTTETACLNVC